MAKYNESVRDTYGLGRVTGEVGLELEMEGRSFIPGGIAPYWSFHRDGSLRGEENAEYVLAQPIPRKDVPAALDNLFSALKKNGCKIRKDSPNTSVHVHLNMQEWSIKKVYNLICLWYIFEQTLVDWCGEERSGNLFCLRGGDAEVALMRLSSAIRYGRMNTLADQEGLRYTAMNYTALSKFGSLEFRSLAGVYEEDVINKWVRILLALKDYAERFVSPSDIIVEMSKLGHEEFLRAVFGDLAKEVTNKDITAQMQAGMRLIQGVAYCVNWHRDTEVKKKEPLGNDDSVGTIWRERFIQADEDFPEYDGEGDVHEYVSQRDHHNLIKRQRVAQREQQGNLPPLQGMPPRPAGRARSWHVDQEGAFHEVHDIDLDWARRQGWTVWRAGDVPAIEPHIPVPVQAVVEELVVRIGDEGLRYYAYTDRNGRTREISHGGGAAMTDVAGRGMRHWVTRRDIAEQINQGWTF